MGIVFVGNRIIADELSIKADDLFCDVQIHCKVLDVKSSNENGHKISMCNIIGANIINLSSCNLGDHFEKCTFSECEFDKDIKLSTNCIGSDNFLKID